MINLDLDIKKHFAILTLNRPQVHNAVNDEMMSELEAALDTIEANEKIRCIVLTGKGKSFCAGGDLKYFAKLFTVDEVEEMSRRMQQILDRLYFGKNFVIAAINGAALGGGCEILTACHYRIAADTATFAFRQTPNGITTGWGGGRRLLVQLKRSNALRLLLTGETIDAVQAVDIGLIDEAVPPTSLINRTLQFIETILQNDPDAQRAILKLAQKMMTADWETLAKLETQQFVDCWMGPRFKSILSKYRSDTGE
jgi:enoyl-CoA hydratase/carnithine racemase